MEGEACALSDIATLEGRRDLTERIGSLLLSAQNGVITREHVISALKTSGLEDVRVELKMPLAVKAVKIGETGEAEETGEGETAAQPSEPSDLFLAEWIKSLSSWEGDVEVQHRGPIPEGRLVSPASIVPGTSAATLRFRNSSGKERSLPVRLIWSQPALILTRSAKKGEILKESDLTLRSIRVNKALYASKMSQVVGRSLKRNLSQGEPILLDSVTDVPMIERGKSVTIVVRNAGLTVRAKGEALESGALGYAIKVRNVASKTVITAVVVASDTVEVP